VQRKSRCPGSHFLLRVDVCQICARRQRLPLSPELGEWFDLDVATIQLRVLGCLLGGVLGLFSIGVGVHSWTKNNFGL
jgi:hypothetical protein